MSRTPAEGPAPAKSARISGYEPPRVETELTAEQLERESHYAGGTG